MFRKIICAVLLSTASAACSKSGTDGSDNPSNALLQKETYGIYADDDDVFVYDNDIHQYAYNTGRHTFRIQNTAQDRYLTCELDNTPTASSTVNVRVKTQGISSYPSRELQMLVLKRADGKAWLWNEENRTGLVIRIE